MSISIDPLGLLKDYVRNRREKKELDKLLNKNYRLQTREETFVCKLLSLQKIGNDYMLTVETDEHKTKIPFGNIVSMQEIEKEEYEFPRKLDELISISESRSERRPGYLSWIIDSSKPIRDSAIKWFNFEISQIKKQIEILILLFPHREYQNWREEVTSISSDFDKAIKELDSVLAVIEKKEATRIGDIYRKNDLGRLTVLSKENEGSETPNILGAFIGIFGAGQKLEGLIAKVEGTISNIQDTATIARIQQYRSKGS